MAEPDPTDLRELADRCDDRRLGDYCGFVAVNEWPDTPNLRAFRSPEAPA